GVGRMGPFMAGGMGVMGGIQNLPAMIQWIRGFCDSNPDSNALGAVGIPLESVCAVLAAIMRGLAVNYVVSNYSNAIWRLRPAGAFGNGRVGVRPLPPARLLRVPGLFHLVEQIVDRVPIAPISGCHNLGHRHWSHGVLEHREKRHALLRAKHLVGGAHQSPAATLAVELGRKLAFLDVAAADV